MKLEPKWSNRGEDATKGTRLRIRQQKHDFVQVLPKFVVMRLRPGSRSSQGSRPIGLIRTFGLTVVPDAHLDGHEAVVHRAGHLMAKPCRNPGKYALETVHTSKRATRNKFGLHPSPGGVIFAWCRFWLDSGDFRLDSVAHAPARDKTGPRRRFLSGFPRFGGGRECPLPQDVGIMR